MMNGGGLCTGATIGSTTVMRLHSGKYAKMLQNMCSNTTDRVFAAELTLGAGFHRRPARAVRTSKEEWHGREQGAAVIQGVQSRMLESVKRENT